MALLDYIDCPSPIHRIDPRIRIAVGFLLMIATTVSTSPSGPSAALVFALVAAAAARLPLRRLGPRLLVANIFLSFFWISLPLTEGREGLATALQITLKTNAILLYLSVFLSTIEAATLGHALAHLRVPRKLAHILLFSVRYAEILHREQQRIWWAMKARAFRPRSDLHTYKTFARGIGFLIVRSLDRAERVLAAMKCRGYRGEFYLLHHFHYRPIDAWIVFAALFAATIIIVGGIPWRLPCWN